MDKDKIELKTVMESAAVAEYLTALAKGFKTGQLTIEKDGECLCLAPAELAEVEVEARVKKDKARFSLEVSWRLTGVEDDPASLKISADAPKDKQKDAPKDAQKDAKPAAKVDAKPVKDEKKDEKKEEKKPEAAPMVKVVSSPAAPAQKPAGPSTAPTAHAASAMTDPKTAPKA